MRTLMGLYLVILSDSEESIPPHLHPPPRGDCVVITILSP
jgi:hypothetical protein